MLKYIALLAILSSFAAVHAQSNSSSSPISRDGTQLPSFGNCTCDLTRGSCDLFCCCDPSCSAANIKQFAGKCKEKIPSSVVPLCLSSNTFVKINANTLKDSPLCVERMNSPLLGDFYAAPPSSFSASEIASGKSSTLKPNVSTLQQSQMQFPIHSSSAAMAGKRASLSGAAPQVAVAGPYTPGKLLTAAVSVSNSLLPHPAGGFFTFLQPGPSGSCTPGPIAFFDNIPPATCYLSAAAGSVCGNADAFSSIVSDSLNSLIATKHNAPYTDPSLFRSIKRFFRANVQLHNSSTAPSNQCTVPVSITLLLQHDGAGAIIAAFTDEVHAISHSSKSYAPLTVSVEYVTYNPETTQPPVFIKSGNPGYIPGHPVLAASVSSGLVAVDPSGFRLPYAGDAFGSCLQPHLLPAAGSGLSVLFNVDSGAGCRLSMNQSYFDELCQTGGTVAFFSLPQNIAIGRWGDASAATAQDWLPITAPSVASSPKLTLSVCQSMVTGLDISIVYTAAGLKSNPQFTILGAVAAFVSQDVVRPLDAQPNSSVTVSLSTTISFIFKAPASSESIFASPPRVLPPLPADIFYPFIMESPASSLSVSAAFHFAAVAAAAVLFML